MIDKKNIVFNKIMTLFLKVIIYNVIFYCICCLLKLEPFAWDTLIYRTIPTNYFIMLYSVLLVFVPFINMAFNALPEKKLHLLMAIVCVTFLLEPTVVNYFQNVANVSLVGVNTCSMNGDDAGYTIVHFVVMYLIGGYIRKEKDIFNRVSAKWYGVAYIALALAILFLSRLFPSTFYYNNLFVVSESVALFKMFDLLKIHSIRLINVLGSFSLDIFLIHTNTLFLVHFWSKFQIAVHYSTLQFGQLFSFTLFTTLSMYFVCLGVAVVYRVLFKRVEERLLLKHLFVIDYS